MLYRPKAPNRMWDCTLYYEAPDYHLFYLSSGNIGHVSTADFVVFREYPPINGFGGEGAWNQNGVPLTGTLAKTNEGYKMLLGGIDPKSLKQCYGLFLSDDLVHWREYEHNPVLLADGELYESEPSDRDGWMYTAWRDPQVYALEDGWYHLCMCARLKKFPAQSTGAAIAHLRTRDFVEFESLPPFSDVGRLTKYAECPDRFDLNGRTYLTFLDHSWGGLRTHTESRRDPAGTFYQIFDSNQNRFAFPRDSLLIGSANNRQCAWAARTCVGENGDRILYFHITADSPSFGIPKLVSSARDGSLRLEYFPKMDRLCGVPIPLQGETLADDGGTWTQIADHFSGFIGVYGSAFPIAEAENCVIDCEITVSGGDKAGIAFWQKPGEREGAAVLWLDYFGKRILVEWAHRRPFEGFGDLQEDVVNGGTLRERDEKAVPLTYGKTYHVKCFAKDSTLDVYLDDVWVLCKRFPMCEPSGSLSLLVERAQADFDVRMLCRMKDAVTVTNE